MWFASYAEGLPPAAGDGNCTIDITVQTTPSFTEQLQCHYSNYPVFKSDHLTWNTPKNAAGLTVNLSGKTTGDSANLDLPDAKIPYVDGNGNTVSIPKVGYVYGLNSTSKNGWHGVVDVFATPNDPTPVECQGGYYGSNLPPIPYVTGSALQLKWSTVDNQGGVVHGTAEALLSCSKINLKGPRTPLGMIGKAVIKF
jgi:adhesin HecA-like repeat protein